MNNKRFQVVVFGCVLLLMYSILYLNAEGQPTLESIHLLGYVALVQFVYIILSWYYIEKSMFNAYVVFVIALYAFNLGQPILEAFGLVAESRDLLRNETSFGISYRMYYAATYIGMLFTLAFHFGAIYSLKKKTIQLSTFAVKDRVTFNYKMEAIWKSGIIILIITLPFYFYNIFEKIGVVLIYGYGGLYDDNVGNKYITMISSYYTPALIALFFVSEYFKRKVNLIRGVIIFTVLLPPLLLGGRSDAMIIFAVLLIIYMLYYKLNVKRIVLMGCSLYILLFVFGIIAKTRNDTNKSQALYVNTIKDMNTNPVSETLTEMGYSLYPMAHTYDIIPKNIDYKLGESYFYAFSSLIPNIGFWNVHPAKLKADLGDWLMKYNNLGYGPGYSIIAEAYYNFGFCGFFVFLLSGYLYCHLFQYVKREKMFENPFLLIIALIFFWLSIKTVRNSFLATVRNFFYVCLPIYFIMKYQYEIIKNKYYIK